MLAGDSEELRTPKLGPMNKSLDPRGRYDAVIAAEGLFQVEPAPQTERDSTPQARGPISNA
jgi:hypothetical protein